LPAIGRVRPLKPRRGAKKDPEPKLGVFSPDGYSGGKGGAARLKRIATFAQITDGPGVGSCGSRESKKIFDGEFCRKTRGFPDLMARGADIAGREA
jgi:hypothetical protein